MRQVIIDGDILVYEACAAGETRVDWGDGEGEQALAGDLTDLTDRVDRVVGDIVSDTSAEEVVVALSDARQNFRKEIYPAYKSNRKGKPKPSFLTEVRQYLRRYYTTLTAPTLEADDVMGIRATARQDVVIASIDKDMLTIPGEHYNWRKPEGSRLRKVTPAEAAYAFFMQVLTGDPSDGYPGLPGVGPKKAAAILGSARSQTTRGWWAAVRTAYAGRGATAALTQARLAFILRDAYYNWNTGEVRLWAPPVDEMETK